MAARGAGAARYRRVGHGRAVPYSLDALREIHSASPGAYSSLALLVRATRYSLPPVVTICTTAGPNASSFASPMP
jgi:hypothetical protein